MKDLHDLVRGWIEKADSDLKQCVCLLAMVALKVRQVILARLPQETYS